MNIPDKKYMYFRDYDHFKSILPNVLYDIYIEDSTGILNVKVNTSILITTSDKYIKEYYEAYSKRLCYTPKDNGLYEEAVNYIKSL